jgi:predicted amidohydrolase
MTRNTLPVALVQERAVIDQGHGNAAANLDRIEQRVAEAAQRGARLVLLQELHNGPYFCQHESVDEFDLAEPVPGPTTGRLGELAKQHGVVIVGSLFERRAAGLYHNTAVVLETDGSLAGRYRKMHIPDDPGFHEKFYFTPGDLGFEPVDTSVGRLGVLVCWDQWYPEGARLMALAGAELLLYPTAIGWDPGDDPDEKSPPARRLDRQPSRPRGGQRAAGAVVQPRRPRAFAAGGGRDRLLGFEPRARPAGRIPRRSRWRTAVAHGRGRPRPQRAGPPHLAVPARPPDRRLRRPAQALS